MPTGHFCEFVVEGILRGAPNERADHYTKALNPQTGWMRREEVRKRENLEPEKNKPTPTPPSPPQEPAQ